MMRALPALLVLALALPAALHADGPAEPENEHQPRHGGHFGDADDLYHYELVPGPEGRLTLYVNDDENKPLDTRGLQGRWTLNPDSPDPVEGPFAPSEDGAFLAASVPWPPPVPEGQDPGVVHVKVEVLKGNDWAPMEFYLPAHGKTE